MCFKGMAENILEEPGEQLEGNWKSVLGDFGERFIEVPLERFGGSAGERCIRDPEEHE